MNEIQLSAIEDSVVADGALMLTEGLFDTRRIRWRLSGEQVNTLQTYIGPRVCRRVLRAASFSPDPGEIDDWFSASSYRPEQRDVVLTHPEVDFRIMLDDYDVNGRLARALGLAGPQ